MSKEMNDLLMVGVIAAVTIALRFLPFIIFPEGKPVPEKIKYLSGVLPPAVMGMLVIYCLKGINVFAWSFGLPEIIAVAVTVLIHLWKRNTLFSILAGTVSYMVLIQLVFV